MSGIVAVLPTATPGRAFDVPLLIRTLEDLYIPALAGNAGDQVALEHVLTQLNAANRLLAHPRNEQRLLTNYSWLRRVRGAIHRLDLSVDTAGRRLASLGREMTASDLQVTQHALVRLGASVWNLHRDRVTRLESIRWMLNTAGDRAGIAPGQAVNGYGAIETALRVIDRLEGRGRDSAALHVWVRGPSLAQLLHAAKKRIEERHPALQAGHAVQLVGGGLAFTYQAATVNAQLGDNVAAVREAIAHDTLLRRAMTTLGAEVSVLAGTRSGSLGRISTTTTRPTLGPYTVVAVDEDHGHPHADPVPLALDSGQLSTSDAAMIAATLSRHAGRPASPVKTLTTALSAGSAPLAIAVQSEREPDVVLLGVRGFRRRLYVGFTPGSWIVTSEPHGLSGDAEHYLLLDGAASRTSGQAGCIAVLRKERAPDLTCLDRYHLDGTPHPVGPSEIEALEFTIASPRMPLLQRMRRMPALAHG